MMRYVSTLCTFTRPDIRPDKVAEARAKINASHYGSPEHINLVFDQIVKPLEEACSLSDYSRESSSEQYGESWPSAGA